MAETVTIRLRRPKSELLKKSGGNLNRWLNALIDRALDDPTPAWDAHFKRPRRKFRYTAPEWYLRNVVFGSFTFGSSEHRENLQEKEAVIAEALALGLQVWLQVEKDRCASFLFAR